MGYARAGFDVVGVDIKKSRNYPYEHYQKDALEVLSDSAFTRQFDVIHASPPCQAYSITKHSHTRQHPDLYGPVKKKLCEIGKPWIIENVPGVPMRDAVILCGSMFDLRTIDLDGTELILRRHRLFESSMMLLAPGPCRHDSTQVAGVYGGGSTDRRHAKEVRRGGYTPNNAIAKQLMGIDWMTHKELTQAIPPIYTEFLGLQIMETLGMTP